MPSGTLNNRSGHGILNSGMRLTPGERKALFFLLLIVVGFMPPVTNLANRIEPFVLGLPFLLFWAAFMILFTSACMFVAHRIQERTDK